MTDRDFAIVAVGVGVVGAVMGVLGVALIALSRPKAFALGLVALALSSGAVGVGMYGMVWGIRATDADLAGSTFTRAAKDRLILDEYGAAQNVARVAAAAALLPLLLGAIAVRIGARPRPRDERAGPAHLAPGEAVPGEGRHRVGMVATALGVLVVSGTLGASVTPIYRPAYLFSRDDDDAWRLAQARERVEREWAAGCSDYELALDAFVDTHDAWPRPLRRDPAPIVVDWRGAATRCASWIWDGIKEQGFVERPGAAPPGATWSGKWTRSGLLVSSLLVDERLRDEILATPERDAGDGVPADAGSGTPKSSAPP